MEPTVEELIAWITEGWRFRVKTTRGRRYIIRSRHRVERSLGPYRDELWIQIKELNRPQLHLHREVAELRRTLDAYQSTNSQRDAVSSALFQIRRERCPYIQSMNGRHVCTKYTWPNRPTDLIQRYASVTFRSVPVGQHSEWRFTPHPDVCLLCNPMDALFKRYFTEREAHDALTRRVQLLIEGSQRRFLSHGGKCKYKTAAGYCTKWRNKALVVGRDQRAYSKQGKIYYLDNVTTHPELCVACPETGQPTSVKEMLDTMQQVER